ncbi:VOC family protein [Massilia sp. PAMC28688]|uniref:VOC family protein n=1 Tax=Massilia sp. PAMC28688 TaxID=2861283 RepID=UPI001C62552E|nr:VOC family protein [Massilia sp. PAMC28688]QYF92726.1 VOC family protein [Massilia sp. PAMC28688]
MQIYINIDVDDLERGITFYSALGLHLVRRLFDGAVAEMAGAGALVHLLTKDAGSLTGPGVARTFSRHWTPVHLDFCVDDLDTALARAVAAGAVQESAPRNHRWGRIVTLADPFGHGVCLMQLAPGGYDQVAVQ